MCGQASLENTRLADCRYARFPYCHIYEHTHIQIHIAHDFGVLLLLLLDDDGIYIFGATKKNMDYPPTQSKSERSEKKTDEKQPLSVRILSQLVLLDAPMRKISFKIRRSKTGVCRVFRISRIRNASGRRVAPESGVVCPCPRPH